MVKRRTVTPDSDDEGASSSIEASVSNKRARTKTANGSMPSKRARESRGRDESDKEEHDDAGRDEEDDDETKDFRVKMQANIDAKRATQGAIAEHGVIERVEMHQFMCHRYLDFKFGPQINFIIGHNGSGKSAVLSAITIVLGGKAIATGRGNGLKSFIREGQSAAEVSIWLKNQGDEAYKPKDYGKSICITRRFTKEGSSTWKIKNSDSRVISTKKDELSAICDHMNIQVDNPLNVLTQDSSRQFLGSATPSDKYKFFLRGTQLQQLSDEYDVCMENIRKTSKVLDQKGSALPDLKVAYQEHERRYREANKAREQRQRVDDLKHQMAWAHVQEKESELADRTSTAAESERRIPRIEERLEHAQKTEIEKTAEVTACEEACNNFGSLPQIQEQIDELKKEMKTGKTQLANFQNDIKTGNAQVEACNEQIDGYDREIEKESQRLASDTQAKRDESKRNIDAAAAVVEQEQSMIDANNEQQRSLDESLAATRSAGEAKERELKVLEEKLRRYKDMMAQVEQSAQNKYVAYGKDMLKVLDQIKRTQWYGDTPLGPLGQYVRAKDPKWADVLRAQLGQYLSAFAVTDARDQKTLKQILVQSRNFNMIIISQKDLFDYSAGEPDPQYTTALRVLEISDPYVLRILINQARIERIIVATSRREGEQALRNLKSAGNAWTTDGHNLRRFPEGGEATQPIDMSRVNRLMLADGDVSQQRARIQADIQSQTILRDNLRAEVETLKGTFGRYRRELEQLKTATRKAHDRLTHAKSRHRELQQTVAEDMPANIGALEIAKATAEAEKATVLAQLQDIMTSKVAVDEEQRRRLRESQALNAQIKDHDDERRKLQEAATIAARERAAAQNEVNHYTAKLGEARAELAIKEAAANKAEGEFKTWVESAEKFGPRIPVEDSLKDLERLINSVKKALTEREKRDVANIDDIASDLNRAKLKFDAAEKDLKQMVALNKTLMRSLNLRLSRWQEFRRHIALRCKVVFQLNLSNRGYYGKVLFDHHKGTLNLRVQTDDQASTQARDKDPKSLSGGEKSFSTICLLLALWESIGCPLRCLDEFDVFMDAVNRKISMKLMIDTANASDKKQYILITPQDMGSTQITPAMRVHRMRDPERGQGVLAMS